jgi:hypothetical protein
MDYRDQEKFLYGSRIWGGAVSLCFFVVALAIRFAADGRWHALQTVVFLLVAIAVAVLMYYTPDYLHLSVRPERKPHWETKIRWRIAGAVLLFGMLLAASNGSRLFVLFAAAWVACANWAALKRFLRKNWVYFSG